MGSRALAGQVALLDIPWIYANARPQIRPTPLHRRRASSPTFRLAPAATEPTTTAPGMSGDEPRRSHGPRHQGCRLVFTLGPLFRYRGSSRYTARHTVRHPLRQLANTGKYRRRFSQIRRIARRSTTHTLRLRVSARTWLPGRCWGPAQTPNLDVLPCREVLRETCLDQLGGSSTFIAPVAGSHNQLRWINGPPGWDIVRRAAAGPRGALSPGVARCGTWHPAFASSPADFTSWFHRHSFVTRAAAANVSRVLVRPGSRFLKVEGRSACITLQAEADPLVLVTPERCDTCSVTRPCSSRTPAPDEGRLLGLRAMPYAGTARVPIASTYTDGPLAEGARGAGNLATDQRLDTPSSYSRAVRPRPRPGAVGEFP